MVFSTFHVLIFYLWIFFGKMSVYTFCLFSNLIIFTVEFWQFLHILDTYLSDTWFTNIFLLVCSLFFHIYMFFHKAQVFNLNKMKFTIFFLFALCFLVSSLRTTLDSEYFLLCSLLKVLLISTGKYFLKGFCVYIHEGCLFVVFLFCNVFFWCWYEDNTGLLKWGEVFHSQPYSGNYPMKMMLRLYRFQGILQWKYLDMGISFSELLNY